MSVDYKEIGGRIKARRKQMGSTQERLAERLGVSVGYISQVERGVTKISLDTLSEISVILDCDITDFLGGVTRNRENYLTAEVAESFERLPHEYKRLTMDIIEVISRRASEK